MRNKKIIIAVIVLLIVVVISADIISARKKTSVPAAGGRGKQSLPVQIAVVQTGDISSVNTLTGTVAPNLETNIGTKVAGRVQSVNVSVGQSVQAGQVLAQLDVSDLERQLAQQQAQLHMDETQLQINQNNSNQSAEDYQRNEELFQNSAISKQQLEQFQLKMENDQSQVQVSRGLIEKDNAAAAILEKQISEMTITSPVNGMVATKNIEIGEQVSTQTALFDIVQIDPVKVTVNVSDQIIAEIHPGITAQITVPQLGTNTFQGKVVRVSPVLDNVSHAYPVDILIDNPNRLMMPGMIASVLFTGLKTQPGIIIPAQAVVETTQGSEVFTVVNNVAHMNIVQLGAVSSDKIVIMGGLKQGDRVVISGQCLLADGAPVTVVDSADKAGGKGMIKQIQEGAGK